MKQVNKEIILQILEEMPKEKKESLHKALTRNFMLTSYYGLSFGNFTVYKEGFYLEFKGTRSGFSVYVQDCDGELKFIRKPRKDKLTRLYSEWTNDTLSFIEWYKY